MKIRTLLAIVMMASSAFISTAATTWPIGAINGTGYQTTLMGPHFQLSVPDDINNSFVTVTNGMCLPNVRRDAPTSEGYSNCVYLYFSPTVQSTFKGIVWESATCPAVGIAGGETVKFDFCDNHDGHPELLFASDGYFAFYYRRMQFGNPSGQNGCEYWRNVSGDSPYIKGGVTNFNLRESQNLIQYDAKVYTNTPGLTTHVYGAVDGVAGWTKAGSLGNGTPATHFRATSANGSGAFLWYSHFPDAQFNDASWPNNSLNYDNAAEAMSLTVGPDQSIKGLTIIGPVHATSFIGDGNPVLLIGAGDSLMTTNPSTQVSLPTILVNNYGYTLLTNTSVGGEQSSVAYGGMLDGAWGCFPINTGNRATIITMFDAKNDMGGGYTTYGLTNNLLPLLIQIGTGLEQKASEVGADLVIITSPYTAPAFWNTLTNAPAVEVTRQLLNAWTLSQTNVATIVDIDKIVTPSSFTNSNGSINTNTTVDGIHLTATVNSNIAQAVASAIANSRIIKHPMLVPSTHFSLHYPTTNATGFTVESTGGFNATMRIGNVDANSWFNILTSYPGDLSPAVPITGVTFVSMRDTGGGDYDWGFRFVNAAQTISPLFIDTSMNALGIGMVGNENPAPNTATIRYPVRLLNGISGDSSGLTNAIIRSNSWAHVPSLTYGDNFYCSSNGVPHVIWVDQGGTSHTNRLVP